MDKRLTKTIEDAKKELQEQTDEAIELAKAARSLTAPGENTSNVSTTAINDFTKKGYYEVKTDGWIMIFNRGGYHWNVRTYLNPPWVKAGRTRNEIYNDYNRNYPYEDDTEVITDRKYVDGQLVVTKKLYEGRIRWQIANTVGDKYGGDTDTNLFPVKKGDIIFMVGNYSACRIILRTV